MTVEFRVLRTAAELAVMPDFEELVWGGEDDRVSVNMLVAVVMEGGVALAGFDGDTVVATAFGFPTKDPHVLHSHYMAVHPDRRREGIAERIKRRQAEWCIDNGYTAMRWTFDPLQLTNAHLNLNKLGAVGTHYHVDHYGSLGGINGSLPSDRLTVLWQFDRPQPAYTQHQVVNVPPVTPADIAASSPQAFQARLALRDAVADHLHHGWQVTGVDRVERTYTLSR